MRAAPGRGHADLSRCAHSRWPGVRALPASHVPPGARAPGWPEGKCDTRKRRPLLGTEPRIQQWQETDEIPAPAMVWTREQCGRPSGQRVEPGGQADHFKSNARPLITFASPSRRRGTCARRRAGIWLASWTKPRQGGGHSDLRPRAPSGPSRRPVAKRELDAYRGPGDVQGATRCRIPGLPRHDDHVRRPE